MERIEEITLLYEISKALNQHLDLKKTLYKVLAILSDSMKMVRGMIMILNPLRDEITIEVAHGISPDAVANVKYKIGEGVTGRVIQSGDAIAIPKISKSSMFLDRTASHKSKHWPEHSFICAPVKKGQQVIGSISVDKLYDKAYALEEGKKLLTVIAAMIARHVVYLETIRLEKEQLRKENRRLRAELKKKFISPTLSAKAIKCERFFL